MLNAESAYVRSNLRRAGSYFQRMVHRDTEALAHRVEEYVDDERAFLVGIEGRTIVERAEPTTAAISEVVGSPSEPFSAASTRFDRP